MKKRNLQSSYNYRFQEESKRKRDYEKLKKLKEKVKKTPLDASKELDYIKKLLNGEDVGNFGPEEPLELQGDNPVYWASGNPWLYSATLSEFLSGTTIKQRKRK